MKNILHLLASNKFSGAENVCTTIIKNINENCYYCSPKGTIEETLKDKKIKYIPLKKLSIKNVKKIIKDYNIDIIHAHDYQASFVASFFGKNLKVISHIHCEPNFSKTWNPFSISYLIAARNINQIIIVSESAYKNAIYKNKLKNKIKILLNVVDEKNVLKKANELKVKNYDLVYVGRLTDIKNPLLMFDILNEVKKEKEDISLCIVGDGELKNDCINKANELNLQNNVEFVGFQNNPFPYIKSAKLELITSRSEGIPMSVIEALILDTMVINNGVGGLKDLFKNHNKYICKNINEYKKNIINYLKTDNSKDCKQIRDPYTDLESYIKQLKIIYEGETK